MPVSGRSWSRQTTRSSPFGESRWEGHRGFGHSGGSLGVNVELVQYPDDDELILVLTNRDRPLAAQMLAALRRAALGGTLCR